MNPGVNLAIGYRKILSERHFERTESAFEL
jgi:hypothetical protein